MLMVAIPFDDGLITRLAYMLSDTGGRGKYSDGFEDSMTSRRAGGNSSRRTVEKSTGDSLHIRPDGYSSDTLTAFSVGPGRHEYRFTFCPCDIGDGATVDATSGGWQRGIIKSRVCRTVPDPRTGRVYAHTHMPRKVAIT